MGTPLAQLLCQSGTTSPTIVFPEGGDPAIQQAARRLTAEGLARPLLLDADPPGDASFDTVATNDSTRLDAYAKEYSRRSEMPETVGRRILSSPLSFAAMMVRMGEAHGMVAGIAHPTEEVLLASELILGLKPHVGVSSSFFLVEIPGFDGGEEGRLVFADPAVNPEPNEEQLADIAISTAESVQELLGWEPRVAMLSFSTHGSADHRLVDQVVRATELVRRRNPSLMVDGDLQADAALIESVAQKKVHRESSVAGRANVLVFPDLNSANISSKLVQRLAGATCYGPVLQGFALPVSDLSRGATVDDIVGAALLVATRVRP